MSGYNISAIRSAVECLRLAADYDKELVEKALDVYGGRL